MSDFDHFLTRCRQAVVESVVERRSGHLCSSLSALDILATFAWSHWDHDTCRLGSELVLSKGHAAPALYAVLAELDPSLPRLAGNLRRLGSPFEGHPTRYAMDHVLVSTGSLGLGLAWSVGRALAARRLRDPLAMTVVVSDAELQCGVAYEALRLASCEGLEGLTVVVDHNGWQTDRQVPDRPADLLSALGFTVVVVNGHDHDALLRAYSVESPKKPLAVLAETRRCFGLGPPYESGPEIYGEAIDDDIASTLRAMVGT